MTVNAGGKVGNNVEMIVSIGCVIGAMAISYVESRIIAKNDPLQLKGNTLRETYWRNLSGRERWLFWTGLALLFSPFVFALTAPR